MKKTEIQAKINEKIGTFLAPYGYNLTRIEEGVFTKLFNWGFNDISVSFANYLPYNIRLGASINIRINKVEAILQKFLKRKKKVYENSITYGKSLIGLAQGKSNIYNDVFNYEELDIAIDRVQDIITKYGFDFLKNNSSLVALDFAYNDCTDESLLSVPWHTYYGLIIAKLLNKPNFNKLVQFYSQKAKDFQPVMYIDIFNELVDYLNNSDLTEFKDIPLP